MSGPPLTLFSFAPDTLRLAVQECLSSLGYCVSTLRATDALNSCFDRLRGIAVFLLGQRGLSRNRVLSLLTSIKGAPCFGIFLREQTEWDSEIVDLFGEFSAWPCEEAELRLRLQRLCRLHDTPETQGELSEALIRLNVIGESPAFRKVIHRIKRYSQCDAPVLIEGETGTGKELAARAIHYLGGRKDYPFIPVNCGALPDQLVENELFGHEKGAYTDARAPQNGLVAQAEGGTLFLDELEALSHKGQVALLRFLQEGEYRPLGSSRLVKANVRVISASNASLSQLVTGGEFREDLLYRLNIMPLGMPPLRARTGDVELLIDHFLHSYRIRYGQPSKRLDPAAIRYLTNYEWPGNVRELENFLHRGFLLAEGNVMRLPLERELSPECASVTTYGSGCELVTVRFSDAKAKAIDRFEKDYLSVLMSEFQGNVTRAAKRAGKERRALGKLLKKHGIDKRDYL